MSKFAYVYVDPTLNASGSTPYGIYDNDSAFQADSITVTKWVARRLGFPVMQLEIYSGSIWACFEEAVSEYSLHINNYNMKNWLWDQYGSSNRISGSLTTGSNEPTHPHMGTTFMLSDQYGQAAVVGGDVTLKSGSISLVKDQQDYNLSNWAAVSESSNRLIIQRVYNQGPASITRFYDPFAGSFEQRQMLDAFGLGNVAPAITYTMRPISYDISRAQAIETNDLVRKSAYSFHIVNNVLKIFPRPASTDAGDKIWFDYYVRNDVADISKSYTTYKVSDPSNTPYKFITYNEINSAGRQWVRKFTLALARELLGIIRSKYSSLPLPNGEMTMDGESLKAEGREEKDNLLTELKEFLDSVTLSERSRAEADTAEANQQVLSRSPLQIYIG
jgi:hypothetical protein|tara:strand:+ start:36 stop:1202 length:1167 start_codon:yes stop_codon:yes gene_type:complete